MTPKSLSPKPAALRSEMKAKDSLKRIENTAVHFGKFYVRKKKNSSAVKQSSTLLNRRQIPTPRTTKSDFTQHMVHELAKLTGTVDYSHQVAALLNDSVEPPSFSIESLPADNCAPGDDLDTSYPLWYKDPDKMSCFAGITAKEFFKDEFNINQDYNMFAIKPIVTDEWDVENPGMDANKIEKHRDSLSKNLKKKFCEFSKTSNNSQSDSSEYNSFSDDS